MVMPVAVLPVLRESLESVDMSAAEGSVVVNGDELLLNYCLGYGETDVLLFPVTPGMNYINHARRDMKGGRNGDTPSANVKLRMASGVYEESPDLLHMTIDEIMTEGVRTPTIVYDLVATRDIQPGEEIFMDYGDSWVRAWKKYERDYIEKDYAPVSVWNAKKTTGEPIRTQQEEPYPKNVYLACFVNVGDLSQQRIVWKKEEGLYEDENRYYCRVMERTEVKEDAADKEETTTTFEYTVELDFDVGVTITVENLPQGAIWFEENEPYDPIPFRHFIDVSNELWPRKWTKDE